MEFDLFPTPVRASYLRDQILNPSVPLTYRRKIVSSTLTAAVTLQNSAAETGLLQLVTASQYILYGGVSVTGTGNTTRFVFPAGFFLPGDVLLGYVMGKYRSTISANCIRCRLYGLAIDDGAVELLGNVIDPAPPGVDKLADVKISFLQHIGYQANSAKVVSHLDLETIETDKVEVRKDFDNFIATETPNLQTNIMALYLTLTWTSANVDNIFDIYSFGIELT